jgi:hypothetical protein
MWGLTVVGDVRIPNQLEAVFRSHEFIAVLHFAAASSVGESVADPQKYYTNMLAARLPCCERYAMRVSESWYSPAPAPPTEMQVLIPFRKARRVFQSIHTASRS